MSSWKKVKGLFWQANASGEGEPAPAGELSDAEFAEFLGTSPHAVPPPGPDFSAQNVAARNAAQAGAPLDGWVPQAQPGSAGAFEIDFQAQYDAAGVPDTDEVEQLESFLSRLDDSLP